MNIDLPVHESIESWRALHKHITRQKAGPLRMAACFRIDHSAPAASRVSALTSSVILQHAGTIHTTSIGTTSFAESTPTAAVSIRDWRNLAALLSFRCAFSMVNATPPRPIERVKQAAHAFAGRKERRARSSADVTRSKERRRRAQCDEDGETSPFRLPPPTDQGLENHHKGTLATARRAGKDKI